MYKIKVEWKSQEAQNKLAAHFIFLLNVNSYFYAPARPPPPRPACKHFLVVKWVSFFLLAYGEEIWN